MKLLEQLVQIEGASSDEGKIADFIESELHKPAYGLDMQQNDCIIRIQDNILVSKGIPQTAVISHIDTTGFTVGFDNRLVDIGNPLVYGGEQLKGTVGDHTYYATVVKNHKKHNDGSMELVVKYSSSEEIPLGARMVYAKTPTQSKRCIYAPYLDNRCGTYIALQVLKKCENVAIAFTTGEEHDGGGSLICANALYNKWNIQQSLISDISWDTEFVKMGNGPVVSIRDAYIPRQSYLERVHALADESGVKYQVEVEETGGSDGGYIQRSLVPMDWCFIGPPQKNAHTENESLNKKDIRDTIRLYQFLVDNL